jgi:ELWxxDGT repeat protein
MRPTRTHFILLWLTLLHGFVQAQLPLLIKDLNPTDSNTNVLLDAIWNTVYQNKIYFRANDGVHGYELWVSDGTTVGTFMLKDIDTLPGRSGAPRDFFVFQQKLYFQANDSIHGKELWVTDGSEAGTHLVKDIWPGKGDGFIDIFNRLDTNLSSHFFIFEANDSIHGFEPWVSDGTDTGTHILMDIYPGKKNSLSTGFTFFKGKVYFGAWDGVHGGEMWITDGTTTGTALFKDINPGGMYSHSDPKWFYNFNGLLYFVARDNTYGEEPWISDGTVVGTQLLKDINPGYNSSVPQGFYGYGNAVLFSANDGIHFTEPWMTDGTTNNTHLLKDINTTDSLSSVSACYSLPYKNRLFTSLYDGIHGGELWIFDTIATKITLFKDMNLGLASGGYIPTLGLIFDCRLFTFADNKTKGCDLWVIDGDSAHTKIMLPNFSANYSSYSLGSRGFRLLELNNKLYFFSNYGDTLHFDLYSLDLALKAQATLTPPLCNSDSTGTIKLNLSGGANVYTVDWGNYPTFHSDSLEHLPAGAYTVTVTDTNGCHISDTFTLQTPPPLSAFITQHADAAVASVWGGTPPYTYHWNTQPPQSDSVVYGLLPGAYTVTITDAQGCSFNKTIVLSSVLQTQNGQTFSCYPNPAKDILYIETNELESLSIQNTLGKTVAQFNLSGSNTLYSIDLAPFPAATYLLQLQWKNGGKENVVLVKQ